MKTNVLLNAWVSVLLSFLGIVLSSPLFSQTKTAIKGKISWSDDIYYHVQLLSPNDSSILTASFFERPDFEIHPTHEGSCILQIVSPMLFETYTQLIENTERGTMLDLGLVEVTPIVNKLGDVQVTATVPKVRFSEGKFIYTIQGNEEFKTLDSFTEILKRLPLVSVDKDKIRIFGKKNTIILVNGIRPKNTNWDLLLPEQIKEVQVITNPSAEYSASGMAVINIITQRKAADGFNGQLASTATKGRFWRSSNNLQLGYATDKINIYTTVGYNPYKRQFKDYYERTFSTGEKMYNELKQERTGTNNYNVLGGIDFYPDPKNSIGIQYQRMATKNKSNTDNRNDIHFVDNIQPYQTLTNQEASYSKEIYDLNYSLLLDSLDNRWNVNMGYVRYSANDQSRFEEISSIEKQKQSKTKADIQLFTVHTDYTYQKNTFKGKAGLSYAYNTNKSHYTLLHIDDRNTIIDDNFYNQTRMHENNLSAYITGQKSWKSFHLSAGLRFEYVSYTNKSSKENKSRRYKDLFPSVHLGYDINQQLQASISYAKKVSYPKFQDLNPSTIYVDSVTYYVGNTSLLPEYSHTVSFDLNYNKYVTFSLAYSHLKNPLYMFVERMAPNSIIGLASTKNLKSGNSWTTSLSFPFQHKAWTTHNVLGASFTKNQFVSENTLMKRKKGMFYAYSYHGFKLPYQFNLSLIYQYNSSGINGVFYHNERHILNGSISKPLLDGKLNLSLRVNDLLKQDQQKTKTSLSGIDFIYNATYDASYISLSVKYKFGKSSNKYKEKNTNKEGLKRI